MTYIFRNMRSVWNSRILSRPRVIRSSHRLEQISRGDATDSIDDSPACACATGVCEGSNSNSSTDEASYGASLQCSRSQEKIAWVLRHGIPTQFRIENA
jgi:hypothetical protein